MCRSVFTYPIYLLLLLSIGVVSCDWMDEPAVDPVDRKEQLKNQLLRKIKTSVQSSTIIGIGEQTEPLQEKALLKTLYASNDYGPLWLSEGRPTQAGDSLLHFISRCKYYGLFTSDYHYSILKVHADSLRRDSLVRENMAFLAATDILLTDAALTIGRHLYQGRLPADSVTLRRDTVLPDGFFEKFMGGITSPGTFAATIQGLEPKHQGYVDLKVGLQHFLDSVGGIRPYTFIRFPHVDSLRSLEQLGRRLWEEKLLDSASQAYDTLILRKALLAFQRSHGLKETGRINENTVKALNNTAWEHFKTIAINLDRYKHLPDSMPERYLWVNIPSFYLKVMEADTLALLSRVVVGKPVTPTPVLSSKITNMVTYPQWNIPVSIIRKELLPNLKKNPAYLTKKGYQLVSTNGVSLNPDTIPWKRYTLNIPYRVVQPSGDDNSLGVLKFNFSNKFDVYLHDTDQRYLFRNENRSLSHGCVRVQEWQKLAHFILQTDSLSIKTPKPTYAPTDSLKAWLSRKEKRTITVKNTLPIYIRYFSCEGKEGRVRFYPDIYGVDGRIKDELFSAKTLL